MEFWQNEEKKDRERRMILQIFPHGRDYLRKLYGSNLETWKEYCLSRKRHRRLWLYRRICALKELICDR